MGFADPDLFVIPSSNGAPPPTATRKFLRVDIAKYLVSFSDYITWATVGCRNPVAVGHVVPRVAFSAITVPVDIRCILQKYG
jgi:hypothetical protein